MEIILSGWRTLKWECADCSHYDETVNTVLGKSMIEEDRNMDDPVKHVHLHGKSVNLLHSEALKIFLGTIILGIIERYNNGSEESDHIPKLKKPIKPSASGIFLLVAGDP